MKKDKLQVQTVSTKGKFSNVQLKGVAYLTVTKGYNEPSNQIAIEVDHTTGVGPFKSHREHETALINITFSNKSTWSGTFEELQKALNPIKQVN